ncbi:hypothetical protein C1645_811714 [Glomus cerebriforme]|uniref:Uncharacterized protein n=1 Tax=Glomus cerebriforme TaxID=658196 RepID=A0A397TRZ2_9GLOM|nr:hypothetical protein C1645_811714 [Glomus cerebriforme]
MISAIISSAYQKEVENCISRRWYEECMGAFILSLQFIIMANTSEPSQLEVLALNYLRNQEISTILTKTDPFTLTCLSYNITIELTREEAVLASEKYHLQKKQTDTGQDNEKLITLLGLIEGGFRAGQGNQLKRINLMQIAEMTSMCKKVNLNQEKIYQEDKYLQESLVNKKNSRSYSRLYQKTTHARLCVTKTNQDKILCWYKYAEGFENRIREIRSQDSSVTDPTARSRAYHEVSQHLSTLVKN